MIAMTWVAVLILLGGLKASAVVDAIQAILVVLISVILIPFGLAKIGGVGALHQKVPEVMFNLFGGDAASEYTWYSIGALLLVQLIGIGGTQANMAIAGSAKNEFAARLGAVTGDGRILWGDQLMIVLGRALLAEVPGAAFVGEVKCSQAMFDELARAGGRPEMWKVGHSLIKARMKETGAALAGVRAGSPYSPLPADIQGESASFNLPLISVNRQ